DRAGAHLRARRVGQQARRRDAARGGAGAGAAGRREVKALALVALGASLAAAEPARIGPGTYRPAYAMSAEEREIEVAPFRLDREPVTNADYLAFVRANPEWRRDRAKPLLVDRDYLAHWAGP